MLKLLTFLFSLVLWATSVVALDYRVYNFPEAMATVRETRCSSLVYFGSENNNFFKYAINKESKRLLSNGNVILVKVSMKDQIPYPLTGEMASGQDLANLLGGAPGSILALDDNGHKMEQIMLSSIVHDNDPIIIGDLLKYLEEDRKPDVINLQEYAYITGHSMQWDNLFNRLKNPHPFKDILENSVEFVFVKYDDYKKVEFKKEESIRLKKYKVGEDKNVFYIFSEYFTRASYIQIKELLIKFKGNIDLRIIAPSDEIEAFREHFSQYKAISFWVLVTEMYEYPQLVYVPDNKSGFALRVRGYFPVEFYSGFFKDSDKWAEKNTKVLDADLPFGEYDRIEN